MKTVELYIEDKKVDTFGNEGFTLTFSIAEISEIGKKASSFSKEITLPANDNNNRVFTSLFDVTVDGGFNPISRKRAVLYVDGVALMQGYFKLNSINIKDNEYVTYKGVLFEEQTNFINSIEGFNLDNLVIPVTGSTQVIKPPYTELSTYAITGTTASFIAQLNGTDLYKGFEFGGISFPGTTYGVASSKTRTTTLPNGAVWNPTTVLSYKATSDQLNEINVLITTTNPPNETTKFKYAVIKSDFKTPITGQFTDYTILESEVFYVRRGVTHTLQFTCRLPLFANDEFRLEIYEESGANFTFNSATITGKVFDCVVDTITGQTVNTRNIVNTIQNVTNADQGTIVYPLIDYGEKYRFINLNILGRTFIKNTMFVNSDVIRPFVFVKKVWDAIFEQAGFTYTSKFLNSPDFKKMIIGGGFNDDDISALVYSAFYNTSRPDNIMFTSATNDIQNLNSNNQVTEYFYNHQHMSNTTVDVLPNNSKYFVNDVLYDPYFTHIPSKKFTNVKAHTVEYGRTTGGAIRFYYGYNVPTTEDYGVFPTAAEDGKYRVHAKLSMTTHAAYDKDNPSTLFDYQTRHIIQIQKLRIGSYKYFPTSSTAPAYDKWEVIKESVPFIRQKNLNPQDAVLQLNEVINLNRGDMIRVVIIADANRQGFPTNSNFDKIVNYITIDPDQNNTFMKFYRTGVVNGGTITNAATLLPRSFKQKDFILEIAKMFNLYFEVDKENPRSILIEPRDTYYEAGRILNYERKIDYSKDFNISILSHDYARNQIFKYKNDAKDYFSTEYGKNSANELIFGSFNFQSLNEYNFDETKLELKFAPSYSQQVNDPRLKITKIHDPKLYDTETTVAPKPNYKIEPRIMFYSKVDLNFDDYRLVLVPIFTDANYVRLINGISNITQQERSIVVNAYGYAGHLNDPNNPTFDLNWFTDFNYLPQTSGTTNNLFNIFYKNEMIELTDQSARKVECFVDLKALDIVNLRFNDVYYFKKEYWRLIEIKDYDTSSDINQTTKCTFVKIVRAQTNELIDYGAFGYGGLAGGTAGGLTGTPLDQAQLIGIGGGTVVIDNPIDWDTINRINTDRNKLNYDVSQIDTPIFVPQDEFITPLIDIHNGDISIMKDITLNIQENVDQIGVGEVIYLTDAEYPIGSTIELIETQKRMLVQTTYPFEEGGFIEIKLPSITEDLYDGYTFEIIADTNKGATLTINYLNEKADQVDLYTIDTPLEIDNTGEDPNAIKTIKFVYWEGSDKYLQVL